MRRNKIIESIHNVCLQSKYVKINVNAIDKYVNAFKSGGKLHWSQACPYEYERRINDEDELDFLFLIGSQAFCFWGYPDKWSIKYKGLMLDGWWALVACFERALVEGVPMLDGKYLASMNDDDVSALFEGNPDIPLFSERKYILNTIGAVLTDKYDGRFSNYYTLAPRDAMSLVVDIARTFNGFADISGYRNEKVYFYKKAQVVVTDIYEVFEGKGFGDMVGIDELIGHADYKIPMILRTLGILEYNKKLSARVDNRLEIAVDSDMEIEIRASMLWALHQIVEKLQPKYPNINAVTLGNVLWVQSQTKNPKEKPYHLTKTIYY